VARAETVEREARQALERGTRRDYLSPAAQAAYDRLTAEGWQPGTESSESPKGLPGAAWVAAQQGRKVFACRIPWTRVGVNIATTNMELSKVAETIEAIEAEGWRLDMIGPGSDIYIFRREAQQ
jgi:hypothetical protein